MLRLPFRPFTNGDPHPAPRGRRHAATAPLAGAAMGTVLAVANRRPPAGCPREQLERRLESAPPAPPGAPIIAAMANAAKAVAEQPSGKQISSTAVSAQAPL